MGVVRNRFHWTVILKFIVYLGPGGASSCITHQKPNDMRNSRE